MSRTRFIPTVEVLETRLVPYSITGYKWASLNVSASFMPDGALIGTAPSSLFATYNAKYATAAWETQFARALQSWAAVTPLNFHFVSDSGAREGAYGPAQGDPYF